MTEMTTHERIDRMFAHREADRIPIFDHLWDATLARWQREGMPAETDYVDFFGIDQVVTIIVDNSPQYEEKVIEETDAYRICTTPWGSTRRDWKPRNSTPEHLAFSITTPEAWREAKKRMTPTRDRVNWKHLSKNYKRWRERGAWIRALLWFGFDVAHAHMVGTERLLMALVEQPEWCLDMFTHFLDVNIALLEMVWDEGYRFDCAYWFEDLGFKGKQFMSVEMYRELLKPLHRRVCEWAHAKGIRTHIHSCGDVNPFLPEFIDAGIDALDPLEVKAGMDPLKIKRAYGKELVLEGGTNVLLWDKPDAVEAEIRRLAPAMMESGGYIFGSDHSIPSSVSLRDYQRIVALAKEVGSYR